MTPSADSIGIILFCSSSNPGLLSSNPTILGTFGPVISASKIPTDNPLLANDVAKLIATVIFPTPPFPLATTKTCLISFNAAIILAFIGSIAGILGA